MKEIAALHEQILSVSPSIFGDEFGLIILSRVILTGVERLPEALEEEAKELVAAFNRVVPEDFHYSIMFSADGSSLMIAHELGDVYFDLTNLDFDRSVFEQVESLDWSGKRAEALAGATDLDDDDEDELAPPVVLATHPFQKAFRDEMKDFIKEKRRDASIVSVLMFSERVEELLEQEFKSLAELNEHVPGMMFYRDHIVTVVANGKPMPAKEIDRLKSRALAAQSDMFFGSDEE